MKSRKERLDRLMVERGLVSSRAQAQTLVMAGQVRINGETAIKPSRLVPLQADIELVSPLPYVSRGGVKLEAALEAFAIDVNAKICADIGACTGGFTDVILQRGAKRVYAIDVGYGQLHWKLRRDPRVVVMERTNVRFLEILPEIVNFVSCDVSFISLKLVLPVVQKWISTDANIVALIKPQFEAGRKDVGKKGVVRDPEIHRQVLVDILEWVIQRNLVPLGLIPSPIKGASGNTEFLLWLSPGGQAALSIREAVSEVVP